MDTDFAECVRLCQTGDTVGCYRKLSAVLADDPDDLDARFLLSLLASPSAAHDSATALLDPLSASAARSGNDYEHVATGLRAAGLDKLAAVVFQIAADVDRRDPDREHPWGDKPFNGQEKRSALFRRLVELIDFGAMVETGTFRGTTTLFMQQVGGVDVYSCEANDRYFAYAVKQLADVPLIHLAKSDSRVFLSKLGKNDTLRAKTVFFYLDAHWDADLPLLEELRLILERFPSWIVMIDDFEVANRSDYAFDDYGENAVLSVDLLASIPRDDMALFYPNWPLAGLPDGQRGFVVLASGANAEVIAGLTDDLQRFDRLEALSQQVRRYRGLLRQIAPHLKDLEGSVDRATAARQAEPGYQAALRMAEVELETSRQAVADVAAQMVGLQEALQGELSAARQAVLDQEGHAEGLQAALLAVQAELGAVRRAVVDEEARADALREALRSAEAGVAASRQDLRSAERHAMSQHEALQAAEAELEEVRRAGLDAEARIAALLTAQAGLTAARQDAVETAAASANILEAEVAAVNRRLELTETALGHAKAHIESIHRSTLWRRTRRLVRQIERFRDLRRRPVLQTVGCLRRLVFPPGSRRERLYVRLFQPLARSFAPPPDRTLTYHAADPSLASPDVSLGPLKFIPHDGGFFSNFNFLVGEMYLGRRVYPLFSHAEATRYNQSLKHFAYVDRDCENAWFEFFEPIRYDGSDTIHLDTNGLSSLPDTWGHIAPPEFRLPAATMRLYAREDFSHWRWAVHEAVADKIRPAADIRAGIDDMLARMPGRRIGVHVRHPSHLVEQGSIYFDNYFQVIDEVRTRYPASSLFLATDNELAIAAFQHRYGNAVAYYPGFIRQSIDDVLDWAYSLTRAASDDMGFVDGVGFQTHYKLAASGSDGLRAGKEAVSDAFTLAACDDFVCTASNFTLTCAFINPRQVQHLVSKGVN